MTKKIWCQMILTFVVVAATTVNATEFHVKEFGAKGDGRTDDGPAIQKAFDAAKKSGGKTTVILEKKRYLLGDNPKAWHYFVMENFSDLVIED